MKYLSLTAFVSGVLATTLGPLACGTADVDADPGSQEEDLSFKVDNVDKTLPDVDAIGYQVDLRIDGAPGAETFVADIEGTYVATKSLKELELDFEGNEVDGVTVDGREATSKQKGKTLVIDLPNQVAEGRKFVTRVRYHGTVAQADGANPNDFTSFGGLMVRQKNAEGKRIFASMNWPSKARRWLPLRDHPRDGAMLAFRATMPKSFTVIANGKEVGRKDNDDGTRSVRFQALTPMPTYDFHFAAYENWNVDELSSSAFPIASYTYDRDHGKANAVFGDLPKAATFFETAFGNYRYGRASFLEEPIFGGGMENASVVSMDETLFDAPPEARKTAFHELAHHWSGNLVRIRTWNDFWLSEGFANYLTAEAIGAVDGPEAKLAHVRTYVGGVLYGDKNTRHPLRPGDKDGKEIDVLSIFDAVPYTKGALTLRMLAGIVGEEKLNGFLKEWFKRHAGEAVTTFDFKSELEAETGRDLSAFFDGFVFGEGHPILRVTFEPAAGGADVKVEQIQTAGPSKGFAFPLALDFVDATGKTERVTVDVTGKTTSARVTLARSPTSVVVDPDERLVGSVACDESAKSCRANFGCNKEVDAVAVCVAK